MTKATDTELDAEAEEVYRRIIEESPYVAGDAGETTEVTDIPWASPKLIQEGQEFLRRNYFSYAIAGVASLFFGFSCKSLTTVLLRTGGFGLEDPVRNFYRHISTTVHTKKWCTTDIWNSSSQGFKDIQLVRRMHFRALRTSLTTPLQLMDEEKVADREMKLKILEALKMDLAESVDPKEIPYHLLTYHPKVLISQFDMVMTLFGFTSAVFLFPSSLGIRERNTAGFMHMWAVIGRLLGINDRFNLALHSSPTLYMKLFKNVAIPGLMEMDLTLIQMQASFAQAMSSTFKATSLKSVLYFGLKGNQVGLPQFKGTHLYSLLSWKDKGFCILKKIGIFILLNSDWMRTGLNYFYGKASQKKRQIVEAGEKEKVIQHFRLKYFTSTLNLTPFYLFLAFGVLFFGLRF